MKIKLLLVFPLLLTGCVDPTGDSDIRASAYATFSDAAKERAFELGWLPTSLPASSTQIVEVHNIDSGEVWARFRYADNDVQQITGNCYPGMAVKLPNRKRTQRNAAWWPSELMDKAGQQPGKSWVLFSCPGMQHARSEYLANIAVDQSTRTAWYWIAK